MMEMPPKHAHRIMRRRLSASASAAAIRKRAVEISGAPPSISAIPDEGIDVGDAGAFVRQVGCTRRIFLLKPYLAPAEIEGLAYRIRTLTKNESINSVLIATDDRDDVEAGALSSLLFDRDDPYLHNEDTEEGFPPAPGFTWHVSSGYDPLALFQSGDYKNPQAIDSLLTNLGQLALATRGDFRKTKVPVITIPHGAITDGGFAFCMSPYAMATPESSFRILNPSRGLSLDPVGLSYLLPRLGQEFKQPAAKYPGCAYILGLMGYEADASDMVETGLATHYTDSGDSLGLLEHMLTEIRPWDQQALTKKPMRFYGEPEPTTDHNAVFRNIAVADAVHCFSSYRADGNEMWTNRYYEEFGDPSLDPDFEPGDVSRSSDLVDLAATFDEIFKNERTLVGILESLREVAERKADNPEEREVSDFAADFVKRLERQSPLAASAVFRLLQIGARKEESLESCMTREKKVQAKLFAMKDYVNWAVHATNLRREGETPPFSGWKHKRIADVTKDEVEELLES